MHHETPEIRDTPGASGWSPVQAITLPDLSGAAPPEGLAEMPATELWSGLRALVGVDAARILFDAAEACVAKSAKAASTLN